MNNRKDRVERKNKKNQILKVLIISLIGLLVGLFIYELANNFIARVGKIDGELVVAKRGCLEDRLATRAIVLNSEKVVYAKTEGHLENTVRDGEKVRKGALLAHFVGPSRQTTVYAPMAGIFTRRIDGLEKVFGDLELAEAGLEVFSYQTSKPRDPGGTTLEGEAIFKIVDNLKPNRLLVHFPLEKLDFSVEKNQQIEVAYQGKVLSKACIIDTKSESDELLILLELSDFQEILLDSRYIDLEVIFHSYEGFLVPKGALVDRGEEKGLYCSRDRELVFTPVKIMKMKDDMVVVQGLRENEFFVEKPRI